MHADAHFVIGRAHVNNGKPCQDYATAGRLGIAGVYAIVSDGCSSGGATDIGSRIVALATAKALRAVTNVTGVTQTEIVNAISLAQKGGFDIAEEAFDLTTNDLLATGIYVYADAAHRFVRVHGDGAVAITNTDGTTELFHFEWADNTPTYPAYGRDDYAAFVTYHGGDEGRIKLVCEHWRRSPDGEFNQLPDYNFSLGHAMRGLTLSLDADAQTVAVFTDGIAQIDGLDWKEAAMQLLNFKSMAGEFAKRRLNRFIRDGQAHTFHPIDDLAYAVAVLDNPEETSKEES